MKNIILAVLILVSAHAVFAQPVPEEIWKPKSFDKLSEMEQRLISNLSPINQTNKSYVQLMFDMGVFPTCGVGTKLQHEKLFLAVIDKKTQTRYSYILDFNKALVNESPFYDPTTQTEMYAIAFDQAVKNEVGEVVDETVMVYFYFKPNGELGAMIITSKKTSGFYPLISKVTGKVERSYEINCQAK